MFSGQRNGTKDGPGKYSQVSLEEFSDDDSSNEGGDGVGRGGVGRSPHGSTAAGNSDDFAANSVLRQQQLFAEQDAGLEMLGQSAERLGQMSMAIHEELIDHNKILDEMDGGLDQANENLDLVTRTTKEFIDKAGGIKNCMVIAVLSVIAIILFLLILYT